MIDDELLVKTRTNTCLSYTSAIPSYSVTLLPALLPANRADKNNRKGLELQ